MDTGQELKQPFHPKVMMPVVVYLVHADIVKLFLRKTAVRLGKDDRRTRSPLIAGDRSEGTTAIFNGFLQYFLTDADRLA